MGYHKEIVVPNFEVLVDEEWIFQAILDGTIVPDPDADVTTLAYMLKNKYYIKCFDGPAMLTSRIEEIRYMYKHRFGIEFDAFNDATFVYDDEENKEYGSPQECDDEFGYIAPVII